MKPTKPNRLSYEQRIVLNSLYCATPGLLTSIVLLLSYDAEWEIWFTVLSFIILPAIYFSWKLQSWVTNPLKVAVNILGSIRESDFTLRTHRVAESKGVIVELYNEINDIANRLEKSRTGGIETRKAIDKITENIDVATLIVDEDRQIVQANESARRLVASLNQWEVDPIDQSVDTLHLAFCLDASTGDFSRFSYRDGDRRLEGRRGIFRMDGKRYHLIVLTDITKAASEQERESWKRLLRVLGHELNNSLAPITSLARTLFKLTKATDIEAENKQDILDGLDTISSRSENIVRFMQDYTQLAKLPEPRVAPTPLAPLLQKACQLHPGIATFQLPHAPIVAHADPAQLEQALINLIKNACEASQNQPNSVAIYLKAQADTAIISILDNGPGIANPDNLFVPFYTTKEKGSGIGLVLSKQIVEAIDGTLTLQNRPDTPGCAATIQLPLAP